MINNIIVPGAYRATAVHIALERSSRKGTPNFKVDFGPCDGDPKGIHISYPCWITERASPMSLRALQATGVEAASIDEVLEQWAQTRSLKGFGTQEVMLDVVNEPGPYGMVARVKWVNPAPKSTTVDDSVAQRALAMMYDAPHTTTGELLIEDAADDEEEEA